MLLPRTATPSRALLRTLNSFTTSSNPYLSVSTPLLFPTTTTTTTITTPTLTLPLTITRPASHATQGRANGAKDGPGKRLGAKKSGEQYVIPGNIIFRQRGTHWFAGDNCGMGRDHTIYATESGYVKYYRDPERHPKRKFIGVVFDRGDVLPLPRNAATRRRFGMVAVQREEAVVRAEEEGGMVGGIGNGVGVVAEAPRVGRKAKGGKGRQEEVQKPVLKLRPGYMYREANWEIGRAAERAKVKVRAYKPGDRFTAWRKTVARKARNAERRGLRRK